MMMTIGIISPTGCRCHNRQKLRTMVRTYFLVTDKNGAMNILHPPLQWNECVSQLKMVTDCREWLHSHQPTWEAATINLKYHNYTAVAVIKRNET